MYGLRLRFPAVVLKNQFNKMAAASLEVTNFFEDTNKHVGNLVAKKMRDSNTIKSNLANPYDRVLLIPRIHQLTFKSVFRHKFLDTEREEDVEKGSRALCVKKSGSATINFHYRVYIQSSFLW